VLIDSLENGVLNTDFADRTDSFFFGWDGMKRDMDFCGMKGFYRVLPKKYPKVSKKSMLTYFAI